MVPRHRAARSQTAGPTERRTAEPQAYRAGQRRADAEPCTRRDLERRGRDVMGREAEREGHGEQLGEEGSVPGGPGAPYSLFVGRRVFVPPAGRRGLLRPPPASLQGQYCREENNRS